MEGQTRFGMPRGAKMSLALNEPEKVALLSNTNHTSNRAPQVKIKYRNRIQNNQ
jgi:hypothetical protein